MTQAIQTLIINVDPEATAVQTDMAHLMPPFTPGVYLRGQPVPVVTQHTEAYQMLTVNGVTASRPCFTNLISNSSLWSTGAESAPGNLWDLDYEGGQVLDRNGTVVIPVHMVYTPNRYLLRAPSDPFDGRRLIKAYVEDLLGQVALWNRDQRSLALRRVIWELLGLPHSPEYYRGQVSSEEHQTSPEEDMAEEVLRRLDELLLPIATKIREFTGHRSWKIYLFNMVDGDIYIEEKEDYRLAVFHKKHKNGEWQ